MDTATSERPPKKKRGPRRIDGAALGVKEGSAFYGGTEKQTYGLVARRLIPFHRLGGRIIFIRAELEIWLQSLEGCSLDEAKANQETRHS
jgi:hypothetical protein